MKNYEIRKLSRIPLNIHLVSFESFKEYNDNHIGGYVYVFSNMKDNRHKIGMTDKQTVLARFKQETGREMVIKDEWKITLVVRVNPEVMSAGQFEKILFSDPDMNNARITQSKELFERNGNDLYDEIVNHAIGRATDIFVISNQCFHDRFDEKFKQYNPNKMKSTQPKPHKSSYKSSYFETGEYIYTNKNNGKNNGQQIILKYNKETDTWQLKCNNTWTEPYSKSKMFNGYKKSPSVLRKHGFSYDTHKIMNELRKIN